MRIPEQFIKTVTKTWQGQGLEWLKQLPKLIAYFSDKWQLENIEPFANLSYHYVALAHSKLYTKDVVVKIGIPQKDLAYQQQALAFYNGKGCVQLLDHELAHGGILLEALKPGITLKTLFPAQDVHAVEHAASVIKELHSKPVSFKTLESYPTVEQWLTQLKDYSSEKIPDYLLSSASALSTQLLQSQQKLFVLHGDLHHENILLSERGWLAIDPKGVLGEHTYEVGAFIRNPVIELAQQHNAREVIAQRLTQFAQLLSLDRQRLLDWSFVQALLATCWAVEDDSESWQAFLYVAQLLEEERMHS